MRLIANSGSDVFSSAFAALTGKVSKLQWVSPLADDEFSEYYDAAFLERLGLPHLAPALKNFWPESGPRWDGLAKTSDGGVVLVEAKAHLDEVITDCGAGPKSLAKIIGAFDRTKALLGVPEARRRVSWHSPYYQFCNRMAHLSFLHEHRVRAHLVFLSIADADDVPSPVSRSTWEIVLKHMRRSLALDRHRLSSFDHDVIIPSSDLLISEKGVLL